MDVLLMAGISGKQMIPVVGPVGPEVTLSAGQHSVRGGDRKSGTSTRQPAPAELLLRCRGACLCLVPAQIYVKRGHQAVRDELCINIGCLGNVSSSVALLLQMYVSGLCRDLNLPTPW